MNILLIAITVTVGEAALVGVGASVIQNCIIGAKSVVGAGAVVINTITPETIATGVPARSKKILK
ncbi:hypothetical protein GO013_12705 [Pseudodesulfovibrio sp. JC047]|uniref:hypothetical protein n=1 Tax=Pseudodesulfovibrio sp. JC047 TaxID=2683199 RepID=UPI0013CF57D3|nr:hypothetical protein [Pseudodesulfovibrio sp. JC047]NDV20270.1 hypothetical protein [Pseudodesulfovibrio sp. JC047]